MPRKIVIEINPDNYLVWPEFTELDILAKLRATKFKSRKEVIKKVEEMLPELKKYEDDPPFNDCDD